jgi:hypothetical protein
MVVSKLIFFSEDFHKKIWNKIFPQSDLSFPESSRFSNFSALKVLFFIYFGLQILLPFRFALYPGTLFWTEQGYRFSWRVMLMEKVGYTQFTVSIPDQEKSFEILPSQFLTPVQEKMMNTQPDMILQFSHFLRDRYSLDAKATVEIYVESYATINGQGSRPFIDPNVNLASVKRGYQHKNWVLPYTK